jgi:hypothetical protein
MVSSKEPVLLASNYKIKLYDQPIKLKIMKIYGFPNSDQNPVQGSNILCTP